MQLTRTLLLKAEEDALRLPQAPPPSRAAVDRRHAVHPSTSGPGVVDVLAAAGGSRLGSGASGWTATVLAPTEDVPNQAPSEGKACAAISESAGYLL